MRSVTVVLPASMWAMIPIFLILPSGTALGIPGSWFCAVPAALGTPARPTRCGAFDTTQAPEAPRQRAEPLTAGQQASAPAPPTAAARAGNSVVFCNVVRGLELANAHCSG